MELTDWISTLESIEQGYVRQCFKFWNHTNGGIEPPIPEGMSKSRADILRYHCQALNNGSIGRRRVDKNETISFRPKTDAMKIELALEAAQLDISLSEYVLRCVNAGRPLVTAYPEFQFNFKKPRLQG